MNLKGRNFLTLKDFTPEEILYLLDLSAELKAKKKAGELTEYYKGKNIALIFEKTSTRTRCSFEVAAHDLGMGSTYLDPTGSQIGKKESIADTARVLGRMYDGIEYRGFKQESVELLAEFSGVPVWNGLTDTWHPTQMIADFMTVKEHFGKFEDLTLAYLGDGRNNVANSLLVTSAILGINVKIIAPKELQPESEIVALAKKHQTKGLITITDDTAAVADTDILYTDVWVSMGEKVDFKERIDLLLPYQINQALLNRVRKPNALVLHCLPAFHDLNTEIGREIYERYGYKELEMTDAVFQKHSQTIFQEAENRLHSIKAIMYHSLKNI